MGDEERERFARDGAEANRAALAGERERAYNQNAFGETHK